MAVQQSSSAEEQGMGTRPSIIAVFRHAVLNELTQGSWCQRLEHGNRREGRRSDQDQAGGHAA